MLRNLSRLGVFPAVANTRLASLPCLTTSKRRVGNVIYSRQTPITNAFWAVRQKHKANNLAGVNRASSAEQFDARKLITKTAADSMHEFVSV